MKRSLERTMRLEILDKELQIAQELQSSMLPQQPFFPDYPQIEVDAVMKPAKEVGGDLYDAFALDEQRICLAIGDVAGKGIPAAMFMMRSFTVLRMEMLKTGDLQQTIRAVNHSLSKDNPQCMFVTLTICILNLHSGELQWVNGGHNPPVFGNPARGFHYLPQPKGILVGINPDAEFCLASQCLTPGDMLLLYTDGVTEANNPAQQEFSEPCLLALLNQQRVASAHGMITVIWDAIQNFAAGAEQSDDITLLALRYR